MGWSFPDRVYRRPVLPVAATGQNASQREGRTAMNKERTVRSRSPPDLPWVPPEDATLEWARRGW